MESGIYIHIYGDSGTLYVNANIYNYCARGFAREKRGSQRKRRFFVEWKLAQRKKQEQDFPRTFSDKFNRAAANISMIRGNHQFCK